MACFNCGYGTEHHPLGGTTAETLSTSALTSGWSEGTVGQGLLTSGTGGSSWGLSLGGDESLDSGEVGLSGGDSGVERTLVEIILRCLACNDGSEVCSRGGVEDCLLSGDSAFGSGKSGDVGGECCGLCGSIGSCIKELLEPVGGCSCGISRLLGREISSGSTLSTSKSSSKTVGYAKCGDVCISGRVGICRSGSGCLKIFIGESNDSDLFSNFSNAGDDVSRGLLVCSKGRISGADQSVVSALL